MSIVTTVGHAVMLVADFSGLQLLIISVVPIVILMGILKKMGKF